MACTQILLAQPKAGDKRYKFMFGQIWGDELD